MLGAITEVFHERVRYVVAQEDYVQKMYAGYSTEKYRKVYKRNLRISRVFFVAIAQIIDSLYPRLLLPGLLFDCGLLAIGTLYN